MRGLFSCKLKIKWLKITFKIKIDTINDFPIAFDLIKPVIERTNAKQLQSIEYYSPVCAKKRQQHKRAHTSKYVLYFCFHV